MVYDTTSAWMTWGTGVLMDRAACHDQFPQPGNTQSHNSLLHALHNQTMLLFLRAPLLHAHAAFAVTWTELFGGLCHWYFAPLELLCRACVLKALEGPGAAVTT